MANSLLNGGMIDPGIPFTVKNGIKDTTFPPGTMGFMSFILGPDHENPNIMFYNVVTVRKGKKGKDRLNTNIILAPTFRVKGCKSEGILPTDGERKYLVELAPIKDHKGIDVRKFSELEFMGWLLSRVTFIKKLDEVVYPSQSSIMTTIGLDGHKQMNVWKEKAKTPLSRFANLAERRFNDGRVNELVDEFCSEAAREALIAELASREAVLAVPRMEYKRKTAELMVGALSHVHKSLLGEKVKDKDVLDAEIKRQKKAYSVRKTHYKGVLGTRLEAIKSNRKLLKF